MKTIGTIFLLLALPFLAPAQTNVPAGKVIWWGANNFLHRYYFGFNNGIIENNGEIITNAVKVSANMLQALVLTSDGKVLDFGFDPNGENEIRPELSNVVSVAAERNSSWAIRRDGTVAMWGYDKDEANVVNNLSNIVSIAWAGGKNYLALKNDSTVLGFRLNNSMIQQVKIHGQVLSNVLALASMEFTPLVLKTDGTVLSLGYQTPGAPPAKPHLEMHDGTLWEYLGGESGYLPYQYASANPVFIHGKALNNIAAITHALALKKDGTIVALREENVSSVPTEISNAVAITGGNVALKRDGTIVKWNGDGSYSTDTPVGLSNVVAVSIDEDYGIPFSLAITTGNIPSGVFVRPHGRFEEMAREADLIFKGRVISNTRITNANFRMFRSTMDADATEFKVITALKGEFSTNFVFQHFSGCEDGDPFHGPPPPAYYKFEPGQSYLVFAAKGTNQNSKYFTPPNSTGASNEIWLLAYTPDNYNEGILNTLDARPINGLSYRDAYWFELNLLLKNNANSTNQLFTIDMLDRMSRAEGFEKWQYGCAFKRQDFLAALLPLTTNKNEQVASRAIAYFPDPNKK